MVLTFLLVWINNEIQSNIQLVLQFFDKNPSLVLRLCHGEWQEHFYSVM